jgi:hypothetical protein
MTESPTLDEPQDEDPIVWLHIRLNKRMGSLPPMAVRAWTGLKWLFFLFGIGATFFALLVPGGLPTEIGRYLVALLLAWFIWDRVFTRGRLGLSHILVTSRGVVFTEHDLYLMWDEIESYQLSPELLRIKPKPGRGPSDWRGTRELDLPVTVRNREILRDLFGENVERWKPK